jgi:hypothetical protein
MEFDPSTERRQFGIANMTLSIPALFTAGPRELTAGEANALNQLLAENVRNNLRDDAQKHVTEGGTAETFQSKVDEYVAEYNFGVTRASGPRLDPVEAALQELSIGLAKRIAKKNGEKLSEVGLDVLKERGAALAKDEVWGPKLREKAMQMAAARSLDV